MPRPSQRPFPLRPLALATALLLGACAPVSSAADAGQAPEPSAVSPSPSSPPTADAPAPSASPPATPPVISAPLGAGVPRTPAEVDKLLTAAVDRLRDDPRGAAALLEQLAGDALADAYAAYVALEAGDAERAGAAAQRARDALPEPARGVAEIHRPTPSLEETLRLVRLAIEEYRAGESPRVACAVFEQHPKEAIDAFGGLWGTTRDGYGRNMKELCIARLLERAQPGLSKRVLTAAGDVISAMADVAPLPDGTMYQAMFIGDTDMIRDALLAPELGPPSHSLPLDAEVANAAKTEPAIRGRLPAFKAKQARAVPELSRGICAILKARGRPADPAACSALASAAVTEALSHWLAARHAGLE